MTNMLTVADLVASFEKFARWDWTVLVYLAEGDRNLPYESFSNLTELGNLADFKRFSDVLTARIVGFENVDVRIDTEGSGIELIVKVFI